MIAELFFGDFRFQSENPASGKRKTQLSVMTIFLEKHCHQQNHLSYQPVHFELGAGFWHKTSPSH